MWSGDETKLKGAALRHLFIDQHRQVSESSRVSAICQFSIMKFTLLGVLIAVVGRCEFATFLLRIVIKYDTCAF